MSYYIVVSVPTDGIGRLIQWCIDNTKFTCRSLNQWRQYGILYVTFLFEDEDEAMLFKLTWS